MNDDMNMSGAVETRPETGLPEPTCNVMLKEGFWADEAATASLWADCLARRTEGGRFVEWMAAVAALFGYTREKNPWSLVNIAWFNGAAAAEVKAPWDAVQEPMGGQSQMGRMLLEAVEQVKGVAGHEGRALLEQRDLLRQAFANSGLERLPYEEQLEAAMAGGWLAFGAAHLVTHRALQTELTQQTDWLLCGQVARLVCGSPEGQFNEALARVITADYGANKPLEAQAVGRSAEESLRRARANGWGVCGFLLDGVERGQELVRREPGTVLAVLVELGERLTEQERIFEMLFDGEIGRASDEALWRKGVVQWTSFDLSEHVKEHDRGMALRILRVMYDAQFWSGATREMNRDGTTEDWLDARIAHIAAQAEAAVAAEADE